MNIEFDTQDIEKISNRVAEIVFEKVKSIFSKERKNDSILTVKELAQYLKVDTSWVYTQISLVNIPHVKMGKYPRFKKSEIEKWISKEDGKPDLVAMGKLKAFGSATASSGAVGLYHMENVTPEAKEKGRDLLVDDYQTYVIDDAEYKRVLDSFENR